MSEAGTGEHNNLVLVTALLERNFLMPGMHSECMANGRRSSKQRTLQSDMGSGQREVGEAFPRTAGHLAMPESIT